MKLQLLTAVAATALMAMPSLASADDQGWYVRGNVGYGTMTEMDLSGGLNGAVQGEGNVAGSLGLGYAFGNNWRLELDAAQLWNDLGSVDQIPNSYAKMRTNTAMLNAIYDFSDMGSWTPYVGAGIGFGQSKLNAAAHNSAGHYLLNTNTPACFTDTCKVNDTDTGLAWQLIAGLGYDISERLVWDTQYRYVDLGGLDFLGSGGINGVAGHFNSQVSGANEHILMTGLRYKFGGVAPKKMKRVEPVTVACWDGSSAASLAACPVEAPRVVYTSCWDGSQVESGSACPARPVVQCWDGSTVSDAAACPVQRTVTCWDGSLASDATTCPVQLTYEQSLCANEYRQDIIYYDFNKPQSAETTAKIQRVLDTGKNCAVSSINIVGHTDSSGAASYNLALSKRRAADVRRALVRQGISSALITSEGKGETQLFLDTGDGVKESLNRRTEVLIRLSQTGVVQ